MTMHALVIYDSVFGNTELIARAIGKGLGSQGEVQVLKVGEVQSERLVKVELLIVGSPTRGLRPTEAITDWLKCLPAGSLYDIQVAAFDTRLALQDIDSAPLRMLVRFRGYAAKPIADQLKKRGGDLIAPPEGFFVWKKDGPLKEGELERAEKWGEQICQEYAASRA
jgi:flavodoxin